MVILVKSMEYLLSIHIYNYVKHVISTENDNHSVNETSRCFVQRMRYTQDRFLQTFKYLHWNFVKIFLATCLEGCNNADAKLLSLRLQLIASISQELIA